MGVLNPVVLTMKISNIFLQGFSLSFFSCPFKNTYLDGKLSCFSYTLFREHTTAFKPSDLT